jgi:hypothetical protein
MGQHAISHWSDDWKYKRVYLVFSNMILFFKSFINICTNNQRLYFFKNIFTTCIVMTSFPTHSVLINTFYIYKMKKKNCFAKDNKPFFDMFNDLRLEVILRVVDSGGSLSSVVYIFFLWKVLKFFTSTNIVKFSISLLVMSAEYTCICILILLISICRLSLNIYWSTDIWRYAICFSFEFEKIRLQWSRWEQTK